MVSLNITKRKNKLSLEKLIALPLDFLAMSSPNKQLLAYYSNKSGRYEIHVYDFQTKENKQITHGECPNTPRNPMKWLSNDEILFVKDPIEGNEKNNIYKISVVNGSVAQLTNTPDNSDYVGAVSHDGKVIYFHSDRANNINQIYSMDSNGQNIFQITNFKVPVDIFGSFDFYLSPDDIWIAFNYNDTSNMKNSDIWLSKVDGSEQKKIISIKEGSKDYLGCWSEDGQMIAFTSDIKDINTVGIYYLETEKIRWFGNGTYEEEIALITSDCLSLIVRRYVDASIKIIKYNINTLEETELKLPAGFSFTRCSALDENHLVINHQDSTHRPRHLLYNLKTDTFTEILFAEYGEFTSSDFYPDEYISYLSADKTKIHALLYKPKGVTKEEKLPAIIMPHGGPTSHYMRMFNTEAQVLADHGYVLLQPNVRGSTGYGVKFRDACIKDWGGKDLEDIVGAVNFLKTLDYVDPTRIGITGGSYGGYMTYIAMTKAPEYWKAGCAYMGITDILKLYEDNSKTYPFLNYYLDQQMGKPNNEQTLALWKDRSAINFAHNLKGKLLIIHGENDPRCPLNQAELFKNKLIQYGKKEHEDFEYIILKSQGHGSLDIQQRIEYINHLLDFFSKYL